MSSIIRPSFSFRNLPIYQIHNTDRKVQNISVPHSLDFVSKEGYKEIEMGIDSVNILWRVRGGEWQVLIALEELRGIPGISGNDGKEVFLKRGDTHIEWKLGESGTWSNLVDLEGLKDKDGNDGKEVSLQVNNSNVLQWRLGDGNWENLFDLSLLTPELHFSPTFTGTGSEEDPYDVDLPSAVVPNFNPYYFKGTGSALDPIDLKVENLPSGGGVIPTFNTVTAITGTPLVKNVKFTRWGNNTDIRIKQGGRLILDFEFESEIDGWDLFFTVFLNGITNQQRISFYRLNSSSTSTSYITHTAKGKEEDRMYYGSVEILFTGNKIVANSILMLEQTVHETKMHLGADEILNTDEIYAIGVGSAYNFKENSRFTLTQF